MTYQCDQCGACCKGHLIVEAEGLDVIREPRIASGQKLQLDKIIEYLQADFGRCIVLAGDQPCRLLEDNKCLIYPTRPNACVAMQPGDEQCQQARAAEGLAPLSNT